jgi:hypothetical protein
LPSPGDERNHSTHCSSSSSSSSRNTAVETQTKKKNDSSSHSSSSIRIGPKDDFPPGDLKNRVPIKNNQTNNEPTRERESLREKEREI